METLPKSFLSQLFPLLMLSPHHSPDAAKEGFLLHALRGRGLWIRVGKYRFRDKTVKIRKASIMFGDNV